MAEKQDLSLDIWQVTTSFRINISNNKQIILPKNSLLFRIDFKDNFISFKTEEGISFRIHKSILDTKKIEKVF